MESTKKIAILTNGFHKPMGTFSRGYIEDLPFRNIVLFGGMVPIFKVGTSKKHQKIIRYFLTIVAFGNTIILEKYRKWILKRILRSNKIDCVLAEYLNTAASTFEVCKELNIPIISNVLGFEINRQETVLQFQEKYKQLSSYQSYTVPVAKDMITKLEAFGFTKNKIIHSPIGADSRFYKISADYSSKSFFALGRFSETKSPQITIKAFAEVVKHFPDCNLIFGGEGELMSECRILVKKLRIEKNVDFIGWISKEEHLEYLQKSFCFLQHSVTAKNGDKEGTPVAIIEAAAAGLPIISTFHAGIPDVVSNEKTGFLVAENDEKKMADFMIKLYSDRKLAKAMGEAGKQDSLKNTSLKKHLEIIETLINKAITENVTPSKSPKPAATNVYK